MPVRHLNGGVTEPACSSARIRRQFDGNIDQFVGNIDRVVVINDDHSETGGAASIALNSVRLLRQRKVSVTLLTGGRGTNVEFRRLGAEVVSLGGTHLMAGSRGPAAVRGLYDVRTRDTLSHWIAAHDTEGTVYHLHNWHKVLSPSIFSVLNRVASRLVMTAHDYFLSCPNGGYFNYQLRRPCDLTPGGLDCALTNCDRRGYSHKLWRLARHKVRNVLFDLAKTAATVVAVHDGMVPYLERGAISRDAIRVVRNPVTAWRTQRVPAERNNTVFFVGRLESDKGVDLLARAAKCAGAPLCIIGDGSFARTLARSHPEVQLMGWQPRERIAELIGAARMLVVPSRWRETFGLVALESLMSGVPIIISRFSLISAELAGMGLVCDPYNEEALAAAIMELMQSDSRIRDMSYHGFAQARQLAPTPEQWCDTLIALYLDVLDTARQGSSRSSTAGYK